MMDAIWRTVQDAPALCVFVAIAGFAVLSLGVALWIEERRLQRIWAIEAQRDRLLRERDQLWKDGL
jgi:hypothetical protein